MTLAVVAAIFGMPEGQPLSNSLGQDHNVKPEVAVGERGQEEHHDSSDDRDEQLDWRSSCLL